jgi:hypothetical protein
MATTIKYSASTSINRSVLSDANASGTATQLSTNYLKPNSFRFLIAKLPNVTYTCQSANLPALTLGSPMQQTPFVDVPQFGDKVAFGEFAIRFLINEDMSNYKEIYDWIASIGVPTGGDQYGSLTYRANLYEQRDYRAGFSDATLMIMDSNNIPVVRLNFQDLFPTSLEGLDFDLTSAGMEYFVGIATFKYKAFTIEQLNK